MATVQLGWLALNVPSRGTHTNDCEFQSDDINIHEARQVRSKHTILVKPGHISPTE